MHCCAMLHKNGILACLCGHNGMCNRYQLWEDNHCCMDTTKPHKENPNRILAIYCRLMELDDRLLAQVYPWSFLNQRDIKCVSSDRWHMLRRFLADRETIQLVLQSTATMSEHQLQELYVENNLYFNNFTFLAATLTVGTVIKCVNAITDPNAVTPPTTQAIALV